MANGSALAALQQIATNLGHQHNDWTPIRATAWDDVTRGLVLHWMTPTACGEVVIANADLRLGLDFYGITTTAIRLIRESRMANDPEYRKLIEHKAIEIHPVRV